MDYWAESIFLKSKLIEYENLFWLAARDLVYFYDEGEGWRAAVLCGDTFCYACADGEELSSDQAGEVRDVYERYGYSGLIAWVAKVRGQEPLEKFRDSEYLEARSFLEEKLIID